MWGPRLDIRPGPCTLHALTLHQPLLAVAHTSHRDNEHYRANLPPDISTPHHKQRYKFQPYELIERTGRFPSISLPERTADRPRVAPPHPPLTIRDRGRAHARLPPPWRRPSSSLTSKARRYLPATIGGTFPCQQLRNFPCSSAKPKKSHQRCPLVSLTKASM